MARRMILAIIGSELFLDSNTYYVSLNFLRNLDDLIKAGRKSWGAAALACLYRNLCRGTSPTRKGIEVPLLLLQFWEWERMPCITPRVTTPRGDRPYAYRSCLANQWYGDHSNVDTLAHVLVSYRSFFNTLTNDQFKWTPYKEFIDQLPASCKTGRNIWRYIGLLIHWEEVEVHVPQRVARQFGMIQTIPDDFGLLPPTEYVTLSKIQKGRPAIVDWGVKHAKYIDEWDNRHQRIHQGEPWTTTAAGYMQWYYDRTVLLVGKPGNAQPEGEYPAWGATQQFLQAGLLPRLQQEANPQLSQLFADFRTTPREVFSFTQQEECINYTSQNFMFSESQHPQMPPSQHDQGGTSWGAGTSN